MNTRFIKIAASMAALMILVSPADAENQKKKKRKGFFETLFGSSEERSARAERRRQASAERRNWWLRENGVDVYRDPEYRPRKRQLAQDVDYGDPEPIPGLGMGNVGYALPRLQAVADKSLIPLPAIGVDGEAVRIVLSDVKTPVKADQKIRDSVIALYKDSKFKPLWLENGKASSRAKLVLATLKESAKDGLVPARYLPAGLTSFEDVDSQIAGSNIAAAQFDVGLTAAVATYAVHMSGGVFEPGKLSLYHDIQTEPVSPDTALKVLAYTPYPAEYLKTLEPQHPAYAILKAELAKLSTETVERPVPFPLGKRVKPGQSDARIPELRARMVALGHLSAEDADGADPKKLNVLDKTLSKSVKLYQASVGISQTGALDQATVKSFNGIDVGSERDKLIASMERIRWLPKNLGQRYVFVNQAAQEVVVMNQGKREWTSRVIVGRPSTQTAVFSDEMETVVFNPTWGMPQSIIINEYRNKLRRDPGYFDRNGYQVVNARGKKISSRSVNWGAIGPNSGIGVIQKAGSGNALGELKFLFPNTHSIYMHDTPNRELFSQDSRAFSHGCVRVQNPREFAKVLLGITDQDVEARLSTTDTQNVKLGGNVKVHLTYFTAWPDSDGKVRYYSDIYERDRTLDAAHALIARTFGGGSAEKVVQTAAKSTTLVSD
jgi:L,D-transpeptidase YcbB